MTKVTSGADNPERQAYDHELKDGVGIRDRRAAGGLPVGFWCCGPSRSSAWPKPPRAWMLGPRRSRPDYTGRGPSCARKFTGALVSWRQRFFHFTCRGAIGGGRCVSGVARHGPHQRTAATELKVLRSLPAPLPASASERAPLISAGLHQVRVLRSTMPPFSRPRSASACRTVETRCEIRITVRPRMTPPSGSGSAPPSGYRRSTGRRRGSESRGSRSTARAIAVRCFWPAGQVMPRSPTIVS